MESTENNNKDVANDEKTLVATRIDMSSPKSMSGPKRKVKSDKEAKYKVAYEKAVQLREVTDCLKISSRKIRFSIYYSQSCLLMAISIIIIIIFIDDYIYDYDQLLAPSLLTIGLLLFSILFLFGCASEIIKKISLFTKAEILQSQLLDMFDWELMRKKQVYSRYSKPDRFISLIIEEYYSFRKSKACLFVWENAKSHIRLWLLSFVFLIGVLCSMVIMTKSKIG